MHAVAMAVATLLGAGAALLGAGATLLGLLGLLDLRLGSGSSRASTQTTVNRRQIECRSRSIGHHQGGAPLSYGRRDSAGRCRTPNWG